VRSCPPHLRRDPYSRWVGSTWIFGGSEGIGLAVARRAAARGDDVVVLSRSQSKLAAVREAAPTILTRSVDVTDAGAVTDAVDRLVTDHGVPHLVVNTAGYARPGWLEELPADDVRAMVEVNLFGTINVARAVVPHLTAAGRGTLVLTSSLAGLAGVFGYTVYSATKFGVVGFAEALRREIAPSGVQVHVLCPPNTTTPGFATENLHKPAEVLAAEEKAATMTPDVVADELLRSLRRKRFLIVPGRSNRFAAWAIRHLPAVVDRQLRRPS